MSGSGSGETVLQRLVGRVRTWDEGVLSGDALQDAKLLVLDTVGCAFGGWHEATARSAVQIVGKLGGSHDCQIIGSKGRTNLTGAVLANGMLARVLDLNDYVPGDPAAGGDLGGHPSDNIPVALAAGELAGSSGRAILEAIIVGYEIYGRAAGMMKRGSTWDGVTVSGLVAPMMAGRLLGLDDEQLSHALALSMARCATSAAVRSGDISAAKSLANALVAQNGVQAALLAREGLTGPLGVIEQAKGLVDVFPNADQREGLVAPFPDFPYIRRARIKAYPCVATSQALAAAAIALHGKMGGVVDGIEAIRIMMADYVVTRRHQADPVRARPQSREAADHSFPFIAAVGLIDGEVGLAQFEGERWTDPKVMALIERVEMGLDPSLNARATNGYPCRLEVSCRDGRRFVFEVIEPPGGGKQLDGDQVLAKFERVTHGLVGATERRRIVETVMGLDQGAGARDLAAAVAVDVGH